MNAVLIVILIGAGAHNAPAVAMHDFRTRELCEIAAAKVMTYSPQTWGRRPDVAAYCVDK